MQKGENITNGRKNKEEILWNVVFRAGQSHEFHELAAAVNLAGPTLNQCSQPPTMDGGEVSQGPFPSCVDTDSRWMLRGKE